MKTQLPPESLESRIAPAAVSGLGDEFVGPTDAPRAAHLPAEAAPAPILADDGVHSVHAVRTGNIDLATQVSNITTVSPVPTQDLTGLSAEASEIIHGAAATLDTLATSALGGAPTGIGTLGIGDQAGTPAGIDTKSALQSGAANISDLVLVGVGGFAGANPESLLIVKV